MDAAKLARTEQVVLEVFVDVYGAPLDALMNELGVASREELLEQCPSDWDRGPESFYENLRDRLEVSGDPENARFEGIGGSLEGFGGSLKEIIAFVADRWDGRTFLEPWKVGKPPDEDQES